VISEISLSQARKSKGSETHLLLILLVQVEELLGILPHRPLPRHKTVLKIVIAKMKML
jgi:hypothetical protein